MMRRSLRWTAPVWVLLLAGGELAAAEGDMRVANQVFSAGRSEELLAESVTIWLGDTVYDRLTSPPQTIVFDPPRDRVVVLDRERELRVELRYTALSDFADRLRRWAATSSDPLLANAATSDGAVSTDEEQRRLELTMDGLSYEVDAEAAEKAIADRYREFADAAVLTQSVLRPGGSPPFARLKLNAELAAQGWLPSVVSLEIDARRTPSGRVPAVRLRSEHDLDPGLADSDRRLVREAHAQMVDFEKVTVEEFVGRPLPVAFDD